MESSTQITVRPAGPEDAPFVADCNVRLARESEDITLDADRVREGVAAVFDDRAKGFYLIAEIAGQRAGQLMITYEWSDWRNGVFWWFQSVYTMPEFRGRGVFRALYSQVESLADQAGNVCGLRLYVAPTNERAQATYLNRGLHDSGYLLYERDFVIHRTGSSTGPGHPPDRVIHRPEA
jgi:GNAT superfamily N-acetyltransferase